MQKLPPGDPNVDNGNVTVAGDGVYLKPNSGTDPAVVKVLDGNSVILTYYPNGSWTWQQGPRQSGAAAAAVSPSLVFPADLPDNWPVNPLKPGTAQPPNTQPK